MLGAFVTPIRMSGDVSTVRQVKIVVNDPPILIRKDPGPQIPSPEIPLEITPRDTHCNYPSNIPLTYFPQQAVIPARGSP